MKRLLTFILFSTLSMSLYAQGESFEDYNYTLEKLNINTAYSDFGTSFYGKDKVVFSSPKKKNIFTEEADNSEPYLELYMGDIDQQGNIVNVTKFDKKLNAKYHDAQVTISRDRNTVYFTSNNTRGLFFKKGENNYDNLQLYRATVDGSGRYKHVEKLPFNSDDYSCGHPVLANNDSELYFISDMPGGYGKTDIYKVNISSSGKVSKPFNLGSKINTSAKEMFPSIKDGVLYYASEKPGGLGGLDIYANKLDSGGVGNGYHFPSPVNSSQDDFAFVQRDAGLAYLSSNRTGGKGSDDIYKIRIKPIPCIQRLEGMVKDDLSGVPLGFASVLVYDANNVIVGSTSTDGSGAYRLSQELLCATDYRITASKTRYEGNETGITTHKKSAVNVANLSLKPIIIDIPPIYFDYDKYDIREDASKVLDEVVSTMKQYPTMVVEGGSHTDVRGSNQYNEELSASRAKATIDYIISKGIDASRISSRGYGEQNLANDCKECSEEEHQQNRRTEFKIVSY